MALPLRCRCGHVRGVAREVAPHSSFRFVCYCTNCQAFARFLERPDVLDDAGGTDIVHMPAACVTLTAGADAVCCISFSAKVLRWYADCCRTPIANTAVSPRFPVVGLIHSFLDHEAGGHAREQVLGPPLCRIYERSGIARAAGRAASAIAPPLRPPRSKNSRLVDAWARSAKPVL